MFVALLWLMIGIVYLANAALIGFAAIGLAWAPFGALVYAREGKRRGHSPVRYAVTGAVYSLLFYVPWLYGKKWIDHKPLPRNNVVWAYAFLYLIWILVPIPLWAVLLSGYRLMSDLLIGGLLAFVALTLLILVRARKRSDIGNGYLPRLPYLLPLLGLYGSYMPFSVPILQAWISGETS